MTPGREWRPRYELPWTPGRTLARYSGLTQVSNHMQQPTARIPRLGFTRRVPQRVQCPADEPQGAKRRGCERLEETGKGQAEEKGRERFERVGVSALGAVEAVSASVAQRSEVGGEGRSRRELGSA